VVKAADNCGISHIHALKLAWVAVCRTKSICCRRPATAEVPGKNHSKRSAFSYEYFSFNSGPAPTQSILMQDAALRKTKSGLFPAHTPWPDPARVVFLEPRIIETIRARQMIIALIVHPVERQWFDAPTLATWKSASLSQPAT